MKSKKVVLCTIATGALLFSSCVSTSDSNIAVKEDASEQTEKDTENIINNDDLNNNEFNENIDVNTDLELEDIDIDNAENNGNIDNFNNSKDNDNVDFNSNSDDDVEFLDEVEFVEPTPEELYLESLGEISISLVSSPAETNKGKAFKNPFVVKVSDINGEPVADFPIVVKYPAQRNLSEIVFEQAVINSDFDGNVTFTPESKTFAVNTFVNFEPAVPEDFDSEFINSEVKPLFDERGLIINAPWKVKSDLARKGAVLFIWEYNELNKPTGNSYDILSVFRSNGVYNIGNAPVNETSDIGKDKKTLYKQNYEIIGNDFGYLIGGTIKFVQPVSKVEDGYEAQLIAEIYAIDMNTGKEIFQSTFEKSAIGANWNKCVSACKSELAKDIVNSLFYGL